MRYMIAGDAGNLVAQMRRGVLPYCVLAMVRDKERYGFELVQSLASIDGMVTGEGTIYPILNRLRAEGLVQSQWVEAEAGHPRKYYQLTQSGRERATRMAETWTEFSASLGCLIEPVLNERKMEQPL